MPKKERCKFRVKFFIKERDGNLVRFDEKIYLDVEWKGNLGTINPKDSKVRIKKNSKEYCFIAKVYELRKGWFYDEINGLTAEGGFIPDPSSDFTIIYPVSQAIRETDMPRESKKRVLWEKDPNKEFNLIRPVQLRFWGPTFIIVIILSLLFVGYKISRFNKWICF